jgi:hypothetical protein
VVLIGVDDVMDSTVVDLIARVDGRVVSLSPPAVVIAAVVATPLLLLQPSQPTVEVLTDVDRRVDSDDDDEATDPTEEMDELLAVT